ncbi:unnamed protein product [Brassica rapa]|uniref:Uncharacterized protein n=2 Tax=Brassica TaxID=3705 RepID=A0A8D9GQY5_BRACM|nr:unnamed protein product [Brassica napus]CAG7885345.1 unnamed protein product [Brassica rapa]
MLARHKSDSATTETKAGTSLATFENRRDSECDSQKVTGVNGETKKNTREPELQRKVAAIQRRTQSDDQAMIPERLEAYKTTRKIAHLARPHELDRDQCHLHLHTNTRNSSPDKTPEQSLTSTERR